MIKKSIIIHTENATGKNILQFLLGTKDTYTYITLAVNSVTAIGSHQFFILSEIIGNLEICHYLP